METGWHFLFYVKEAHKNKQEKTKIISRCQPYGVPENKNDNKN